MGGGGREGVRGKGAWAAGEVDEGEGEGRGAAGGGKGKGVGGGGSGGGGGGGGGRGGGEGCSSLRPCMKSPKFESTWHHAVITETCLYV